MKAVSLRQCKPVAGAAILDMDRQATSSFILHPSSFILHPSSFILLTSSFILLTSSFL
jgi:hypothetical protein